MNKSKDIKGKYSKYSIECGNNNKTYKKKRRRGSWEII